MSRNQRGAGANSAVEDAPVTETPVAEIGANRTAMFHSFHPRVGTPSRASYTIPGVPGNIVIFLSMFADGVAPPSLTLDCLLAEPKTDNKSARAEAAALKAAERAAKAQARLEASQLKATERAAKAQAAADAAMAKIAAAVGGSL